MDGSRFDHLARRWATRRTALGGLVAGGFSGFIGLDAEAKRKQKRKNDHPGAGKEKHGAVIAAKKKKKKKKCKGGTIKCGKVCVTASTDAQNCGGCGIRCGSSQACVSGSCASTGPLTCPTGQIRCDGQCVDPASNEAHCGGCGQPCTGNLTCLSGTCGCADGGDTQCSTSCVDLQSDEDHCGGCGAACGTGQRCEGGQCVTATCSANEILCNGSCVTSIGAHPCCSQADCGGAVNETNHIRCDMTQHQCRCDNTNLGICQRTPDKRGICRACCPGGIEDLNCQGELGCFGYDTCSCPPGESQCPGGSYRCYQDQLNPDNTRDDPTVCVDASGHCVDCTLGGTRPYVCCWGRSCLDVAGAPPGFNGTRGEFCGGCERCAEDKVCCKNGEGREPVCKSPVSGYGACPPLDA